MSYRFMPVRREDGRYADSGSTPQLSKKLPGSKKKPENILLLLFIKQHVLNTPQHGNKPIYATRFTPTL